MIFHDMYFSGVIVDVRLIRFEASQLFVWLFAFVLYLHLVQVQSIHKNNVIC